MSPQGLAEGGLGPNLGARRKGEKAGLGGRGGDAEVTADRGKKGGWWRDRGEYPVKAAGERRGCPPG